MRWLASVMLVSGLLYQATRPVPEGIDEDEVTEEILARGKELYEGEGACASCHGENGKGGSSAPDLTDSAWIHSKGDLEGIRLTIWFGVSKEQMNDKSRELEMPPGGGLELDRDTLNAVAAYAWSLSQKK